MVLKILTALKLTCLWCKIPEGFHQCIRLQSLQGRHNIFNALQVVVMDKNHITRRILLHKSPSYSGIRMYDDPTDILTSAIYSNRV